MLAAGAPNVAKIMKFSLKSLKYQEIAKFSIFAKCALFCKKLHLSPQGWKIAYYSNVLLLLFRPGPKL